MSGLADSSVLDSVAIPLQGRVNVFCRLAPLPTASSTSAVILESESILAVRKQQDAANAAGNSNSSSSSASGAPVIRYGFDRILGAGCSQAELFSLACSSFSADWRAGVSATVLAYGQSGTGKSHSLLGPRLAKLLDGSGGEDAANLVARRKSELLTLDSSDGVLPRLLHEIFSSPSLLAAPDVEIELASLQIYCEEISDLLLTLPPAPIASSSTSSPAFFSPLPLAVREHPLYGVHVPGLTWVRVRTLAEVLELVLRASAGRVIASTRLNSTSSRSHLVVMLRRKRSRSVVLSGALSQGPYFGASSTAAEDWDPHSSSVLTLVDLAGSERMKKAFPSSSPTAAGVSYGSSSLGPNLSASAPSLFSSAGPALGTSSSGMLPPSIPLGNTAESKAINLSLTALGNVIAALAKRSKQQSPSTAAGPRAGAVHIPYRNSVLTRLLQRSLNGDARMSLLVTISQLGANLAETQSTCEFGARAAAIRIKPVVAGQPLEAEPKSCTKCSDSERELHRLRAELDDLRGQLKLQKLPSTALADADPSASSFPPSSSLAPGELLSALSPMPMGGQALQDFPLQVEETKSTAPLIGIDKEGVTSGSSSAVDARHQQLIAFYKHENALLKQKLSDAEDKAKEADESSEAAKDELLEVLTLYRDARAMLKQGQEDHVSLMAEAAEELESGRLREEEQRTVIAALETQVQRLQGQNLLLVRRGGAPGSVASFSDDITRQISAAYEDTIEALVTRVEGLEQKLEVLLPLLDGLPNSSLDPARRLPDAMAAELADLTVPSRPSAGQRQGDGRQVAFAADSTLPNSRSSLAAISRLSPSAAPVAAPLSVAHRGLLPVTGTSLQVASVPRPPPDNSNRLRMKPLV